MAMVKRIPETPENVLKTAERSLIAKKDNLPDQTDNRSSVVFPEVMSRSQASRYSGIPERKIGLYQRYGLIKAVRTGKGFTYRKVWIDQFLEEWADYDMSSVENVVASIALKRAREKRNDR